jgi:hypothetical protein
MGREKFSGTIEVAADSDTAEILHQAFHNGTRLWIQSGGSDDWVGEVGISSFSINDAFSHRTISCEFRELPKYRPDDPLRQTIKDYEEALRKSFEEKWMPKKTKPKPEWDDVYRGYVIRDTDAGSGYIGSFKGRSWVTEKKNAERFTKQEALDLIQDPCSNLGEGSFTIEAAT